MKSTTQRKESEGGQVMMRKSALNSGRRNFVKAFAGGAASLMGLSMISNLRVFGSRRRFGVTASNPANGAERVGAQQVPYIYWTWGEIKRGDCTVAPGAVFYLFANGASRWICDLRSSDSGDEWDGRFEIKNLNGQVLAATPNYHFDISQENVSRHWDESRGPNSSLAAAYPNAKSISFDCSC
jgi:hypothetical protein